MESELGREPLGPWLQEDGVGSLALPLAASLLLAASAVVCGPLGGGCGVWVTRAPGLIVV